jgi:hypothetical protein
MRLLCCFLILLSVLLSTLSAQGSILLEHEPGFDVEVRVLFQSVAHVTQANGATVEVADLGSFRGISLQGRDGEQVWHLAYDSLLVRTRDSTGNWREFTVPDAAAAWAQIHMDQRLHITSAEQNRPTVGLTDPVGVLTGAPGMTLPSEPLAPGATWHHELIGSLMGGLSGGVRLPDIPTLTVAAETTLDSLSVRNRDTLAYLTLAGQIRPTSIVRVTGDDPGRFNISGGLLSSLVWSSGWGLFVSGATRVRLVMRRIREQDPQSERGVVTVIKTTRFQVQP